MIQINDERFFTDRLLVWDRAHNTRQMPWKGQKDPYKIWISEIILQQTRVQQGLQYYNNFIKYFPDIRSLATASEEEIYKIWEGLGYYSRCKNLIATARFIHSQLNDTFPRSHTDILGLSGIGPYTAAAISSFAYNEPYAVLDGNVFRVLARFFGKDIPINSAEGKKFYSALAQRLIDRKNPAQYNQAIMDFGAVVCKPQRPLCPNCPLQKKCIAFRTNTTSQLPVKIKRGTSKERFFNYLVLKYKNSFYVRKRTGKDIWQNLYEFVLVESDNLSADPLSLLKRKAVFRLLGPRGFRVKLISGIKTRKLTHQTIQARFYFIEMAQALPDAGDYTLVTKAVLKKLPFPMLIASFLKEKNVSLK